MYTVVPRKRGRSRLISNHRVPPPNSRMTRLRKRIHTYRLAAVHSKTLFSTLFSTFVARFARHSIIYTVFFFLLVWRKDKVVSNTMARQRWKRIASSNQRANRSRSLTDVHRPLQNLSTMRLFLDAVKSIFPGEKWVRQWTHPCACVLPQGQCLQDSARNRKESARETLGHV